MMSIPWSPDEKRVARQIFDLAASRAKKEILGKHEEKAIKSVESLWDYEQEIRIWRKEYVTIFQYSYSSLNICFATCISRGWLAKSNLKGLKEDRIERITSLNC